ncbi:protein LURP-one-related 15-like [Panicum miliaceum]|uniref:Protein LURP-one-related 15-like n=1 Tax=Panicum miliaceum TaxID=4540 RepID=A0A3L6SBY8_PANMI|nr:protein LURP-one-related 15-like [Panicum miliaceum]
MDAPAPATAAAEAPEPAVVNARFCAPEATAFAVVKTISYTGRDFITVTDAAGAAVMQVEAEVGGVRSGGDSASRRNLLFTVVKPSSFQIRTKIYIFLAGNAREEAPDFAIRGSYHDGACTVSPGNSDATIAQASIIFQLQNHAMFHALLITRRNTVQLLGFGRNIYTARINPGIDQAFVLALTVILDEMH